MREWERELSTRPENSTRNPRPWPGRNFHFRPSFWSSLVPIWSLGAGHHSPAILTAENQPERRQSKLEPATVSLYSAGIFAGFGWHHRLDFIPHDSLFHFRPSTVTGSHCFAAGQLMEFHGCRARFLRRYRALELTVGTIELSVIGTLRFELPSQYWPNSSDRWPARVFS